VAALATLLRDAGRPVAVLSRGYGGSFGGECLVVSDGREVRAAAGEAGDEPVMLARELPGVVVAVGRRRDRVGRAVEARFGPRVHLLDDGFQHLRLARDLDLLCVDAEAGLGAPLPAGRLREWPEAASRADLVLLTSADRAPATRVEALAARFGRRRTLRVRRRVLGFVDASGASVPAPQRPWLLAAIARPERLLVDVRERVATVAGTSFFRDHHVVTAHELQTVAARAQASGADAVVTTAKDAVRMPELRPGPPLVVLRIAAAFEDEAALRERLLAVTEHVGAGQDR